MSIKQKFAKLIIKYNELAEKQIGEKPILTSTAGVFIIALGAIGAGSIVNETQTLEEFSHPDEEMIDAQYTAFLSELAQQKQGLLEIEAGVPFALYRHLQSNRDDSDKHEYTILDLKRQYELKDKKSKYERSKRDFVVATHIDERLDEQDAQEFLEAFQSAHGSITNIVGFKHELDYADLFEARNRVTVKRLKSQENLRAQDINNIAAEQINEGAIVGASVGIFSGVLPLLFMVLSNCFHAPLEKWAEGREGVRRRRRPKYPH